MSNFTCPQCHRDLGYSTRDGWVCPVHGTFTEEFLTDAYPADSQTPDLFGEGEA